MRTKIFLLALAVAALAVPAGALASQAGHGPKKPKKATYELHGTLSAYTAATDITPGSITITVSKANKAGRPFVGLPLTFVLDATTQVQPNGPATVITDLDAGSVQVKGPANLDAAGLQLLVPKQVVDEVVAEL
jgi:hypothetical protein